MFVSIKRRKFHDPWGNKFYNRHASPIRLQHYVSNQSKKINTRTDAVDITKVIEGGGGGKYVIAKRNIERVR